MARWRWLGLVVVLAAGIAAADSLVRMVHVSYLQPPVEVSLPFVAPAKPTWQKLMPNAAVTEGERIHTGAGGAVEVELECGSALRLIPDSELTFVQLRRDDHGAAVTTVALGQGTIFLTLRNKDAAHFVMNVSGGQLSGWRSTTRLRIQAMGPREGAIAVLGGRAMLQLDGRRFPLLGAASLIWTGPRVRTGPADRRDGIWERWSQGRDQAFERAAMASRQSQVRDAAALDVPSPAALPAPNDAGISPPPVFGYYAPHSAPPAPDAVRSDRRDREPPPGRIPRCAE